MKLGPYLDESGRTISDVHYESRVSFSTLHDILKREHLLSDLAVAQRLVRACEGKVALADVVRPEVLDALPTNDHAAGGCQGPVEGSGDSGDGEAA